MKELLLPLMRREWLQHRLSWLLVGLVPFGLALFTLLFASVSVNGDNGGTPPAVALAAATVAITTGVMFVLYVCAGVVTVVGLARRDHADRSVEFWLSLPVGHSRSLAVPLAVHLLVVPLLALLWGVLAGVVLSAALVARVHGLGEWLALPWGDGLAALALGVTRLWAGWPLALLWLSPLVLLAMLAFAWFRRWGLFGLGATVAVLLSPLGGIGWQKFLGQTLASIANGAANSLVWAQPQEFNDTSSSRVLAALGDAPLWLLQDFGSSVRALASPVFVGGLMVAALGFYGLVQWRKRGASVAV
jgi:ABC-2 type transport system permease protein